MAFCGECKIDGISALGATYWLSVVQISEFCVSPTFEFARNAAFSHYTCSFNTSGTQQYIYSRVRTRTT
jgi:hypothetical protein